MLRFALICLVIVFSPCAAVAESRYYVCSFVWNFPDGEKGYMGAGSGPTTALNWAASECFHSNEGDPQGICRGAPARSNCRQYEYCRVLRFTTARENHHRGCVENGFLDYDPRPEKGPWKVGVCFKREECRDPRPGIDPF